MNRKVYLDGELGLKFGKEFNIYAKSLADVFKCLDCNFPGMREYFIDCHEKDIGFICEVAGKSIENEDELLLSFGEGDVYISPQPAGSKGALKIVAAIAIVMLVAWAGGYAFLGNSMISFSTAIAATGVPGMIAMGVAMNLAISGFQQMLAPDPSVDDPNTGTAESSYLFRGAQQSVLEGDPVPVVYGQLRIPGRPIGFETRNKNNTYSNYYYNGGRRYYPPNYYEQYNYVLK